MVSQCPVYLFRFSIIPYSGQLYGKFLRNHPSSTPGFSVLTAVANQAAIYIENTELIVKTKVIHEELETRKLVERTKGVLIKRHGLDEEEAFKRIRKASGA